MAWLVDLPPEPADPPGLVAALAAAEDRRPVAEDALPQAIGKLRPKAIGEAAYTFGLQSAVRWYWDRVNETLTARAADLDRVYAFSRIARPVGKGLYLRPPVLVQAGPAVQVAERGEASSATASCTMAEPAALVAAPPPWRDCLVRRFEVLEVHPAVRRDLGSFNRLLAWAVGDHQASDACLRPGERVPQGRARRPDLSGHTPEALASPAARAMLRSARCRLEAQAERAEGGRHDVLTFQETPGELLAWAPTGARP